MLRSHHCRFGDDFVVLLSKCLPLRGELMWDMAAEKYRRVKQPVTGAVMWFRSNVLFGMWLSYSDLATDVVVAMIFLREGHARWFLCSLVFVALPTIVMLAFDLFAPAEKASIFNTRLIPVALDVTRFRVLWETARSLRTNQRAHGDKLMAMAQTMGSLPQLVLQMTWVLMTWKHGALRPDIKAAVFATSIMCSLLGTSVGLVAMLEQAIWPLFFEVGVFWERLEPSPWFRHVATCFFFLDVGGHTVCARARAHVCVCVCVCVL